ncbi:MAG: ATP synthase F1 subunit gamma [Candidatus Kapabacteria bacterium]|nr:ATP synthase F1 subunit gamma [Candidatus Kapabacteria bacterium]
MATLRDMMRRINAIKSTAKITQAMKMISAAKLRRAQDAIMNARPYVKKMEEMLSNLVANVGDDYSHPLVLKHKEVKSIAVIIVTSDRGLCGSFNTNLVRSAMVNLKQNMLNEYPNAKISLLPVGKRGCITLSKEKFPIIAEFQGIYQPLKFQTAKDVISIVKNGYADGTYDLVLVYFNEFINIIKQLPSIKTLLPIQTHQAEKKAVTTDYIFEPGQTEIMDELLPKLLDIQMFRTLLESNAAEQAARMMAMDNATTNARDLIHNLQLVYNKERQAAITKEMLEIVGGAEALKKS